MFWLCEEVKEGHQLNLRRGGGRRYASLRLRETDRRHVDSFCKTVVRNCSRNLKRTKRNADKHSIGEPVEFLLELLGQAAQSSHERMVLHADELSCEIQSETLYEALCSLPEAQRKVLLLGFWGGFGDEEIARRLSVTPRTVYNLRQRAFKVVKAFYEQKRAPP